MTQLKVTKSNYLIEARGYLSLPEQRVILCAIGKLDPREEVPDSVTITATEFSKIMGIPTKEAAVELYKGVDKLYERSVIVSDPEQVEEFRWISSKAKKTKGRGKVSITWSQHVIKYISQIRKSFTSYDLEAVKNLPTVYAIRVYELLIQFRSRCERRIGLDHLKDILGIRGKYPKFKDFRKWILEPSIDSINSTTDIYVTVHYAKTGKSITGLIFEFIDKNNPDKNYISNK